LAVYHGVESRFLQARFSPDGSAVVIVGDRTVHRYPLPAWTPSLQVSVGDVRALRQCGEPSTIAIVGSAGTEVWNLWANERLAVVSDEVVAIGSLPDGEPLCVIQERDARQSMSIRRLCASAPVQRLPSPWACDRRVRAVACCSRRP
jgi:hypothetical protein